MSTYTKYFISGLQKYCTGFPADSDLPSHLGAQLVGTEWANALRINYGSDAIEEKAVPLCSVFEFLKTGKAEAAPFGYYPLSLDKQHIFPDGEKRTFDDLIADFKSEWSKLLNLSPEAFGDTLLYLSKKYFSNAGFSPRFPHISLHEHLKTTAALADCLERSDNRQILLVGAGLDNIQGFCYDIVSSKAAKSLKGRSFFLQMLLDTMQQEIIAHPAIEASLGHVIYARGGKMYLLLPDKSVVQDALTDIRTELITTFWEKFKSSLYGYLQFESFAATADDACVVWERLKKSIRNDRDRQYQNLLLEEFDRFFEPISEGFDTEEPGLAEGRGVGKKQFCRVTGELIEEASLEHNNIEANPNEAPVWVLPAVKFQSDLGEGLREAKHYFLHRKKVLHDILPNNFFHTGSSTRLALPQAGNWMREFKENLQSQFSPTQRCALNDLDFLPTQPNGIANGFTFYGGNNQPVWTDQEGVVRVKDFEKLAGREGEDYKGKGFTRLGVARMDVDDLSQMAEKAQASFALNATFSARLDLILCGYINTIWQNREREYKDYLNIVFAGGDDMLVVGRWDLVLDFIAEVREAFGKFIGGDCLTLSAGMTLVTPKFPIAKAVAMAGEAEDKAKDFNLPDQRTKQKRYEKLPTKNAFCLLGEVVSWDNKEYEFVQYFAQKLELWSSKDNEESTGISAGLMYKLIQFRQLQLQEKQNWRWLSAWYFQQAERNNKKSQAIFYLIKLFLICGIWEAKDGGEIRKFNIHPDRTLLLLALAARLADFKSRLKQQEKNGNSEV